MFHTVYNSFESKPSGRDYIGKHSSDNPYDEYKGSFKERSFDPNCKIVLGYSKTVEGAIWLEMQWQRVFRVAEDPQFANRAYQTSVGFSFSWGGGENHPMYGKKHSEEAIQKMREAKSGEKHPLYGKTGENHPTHGKRHSEEAIQKIREARIGKTLSEETIQKIREANLGKTHSEETIQKMREANSGENNPNFGKKWWVNVAGETLSQVDSPGPEWQNGRVWKLG
jgi:hypothetical protein